jgi:hypothetical protein
MIDVDHVDINSSTSEVTAYAKDGAFILQNIAVAAHERNWELLDLNQASGRLDEVFRDVTRSGDTP